MKKKELSIIIVTYNSQDTIAECIDSIYRFNDLGEALEIIVVDNSPNQETTNLIKEQYPDVFLADGDINTFSAGNNKGVSLSSGEYLLFLNPDTVLAESYFRAAIQHLKKNRQLGLIGIKTLNREGKESASVGIRMGNISALEMCITICLKKLGIFIDKKMFISGANLLISRRLFEKIGGFDENIVSYFEEVDIANRINKFGLKQGYLIRYQLYHLQGQSTVTNARREQIQMESLRYICKKYGYNYISNLDALCRYHCFLECLYRVLKKKKSSDVIRKKIELYQALMCEDTEAIVIHNWDGSIHYYVENGEKIIPKGFEATSEL